MVSLTNLGVVFGAGLLTALATGLGVAPFFVADELSDRLTVALWGLAAGIMFAASAFGLVPEGLAAGTVPQVAAGLVGGALLIVAADRVLSNHEFDPGEFAAADFRKMVLIVGALTVHSFPEGVAIGVAFADLGVDVGGATAAAGIPALAVFMTLAISIQNVPEGLAIAIPLRTYGVGKWRAVWWAVFSSLPQPIAAVIAYYFVVVARRILPYGFGFAAGAMVFLVVHDLIPEGLDRGRDLPGGGRRELAAGLAVGVGTMIAMLVALG
ncbi:ZIP family metal transporter [Natronoarchaeum mannanilyticum]|uniref:ZIP family metal transporter n=1 Tax=Natronoarchaeum mannanilyticum TaxID=926360 RepID=A0AAV3T978_9EURY